MDAIDRRFKITAPERFWSASMAAARGRADRLRGWAAAVQLAPVRDWLLGAQLTEMRDLISSETTAHGPASLLGSFMNDKQA